MAKHKTFENAQLVEFGVTDRGNPYVIFVKQNAEGYTFAWNGHKYESMYGNYVQSEFPLESSEGLHIVEMLREDIKKKL